jgi:hypothetical protein
MVNKADARSPSLNIATLPTCATSLQDRQIVHDARITSRRDIPADVATADDLPDLRRLMGSLHWSAPPMAAVCRLATPMRAVPEVGDAQ